MQALEMNRLVNEFLSCLLSARSAQDQSSQSMRMACLHQASKPALQIKRFALSIIARKWPMLDCPQDVAHEAVARLYMAFMEQAKRPPRIEGDGFNYVYTVILNTARDALRDQIRHSRYVIHQYQPARDEGASSVVATTTDVEAAPTDETAGEPAKVVGAGWLDESASVAHDSALRLDVIRRIAEFERTYKNLPKRRMPHPEMLLHVCLGTSIIGIAHAWFGRDVTGAEEDRVKQWKVATKSVAQVFFQDLNTGSQV
jgi:DNA-directed RNA polymerase specialized sigma24 family protein